MKVGSVLFYQGLSVDSFPLNDESPAWNEEILSCPPKKHNLLLLINRLIIGQWIKNDVVAKIVSGGTLFVIYIFVLRMYVCMYIYVCMYPIRPYFLLDPILKSIIPPPCPPFSMYCTTSLDKARTCLHILYSLYY